MLRPDRDRLDLDLLMIPHATLILAAAIVEPLRAANRIVGRKLYDWRLFGATGAGEVPTTSGISIPVARRFRPEESANPLVIVASYNWQQSATPALMRMLRAAARHRPVIVGVESGAWLMARASLLDDRRATTHWEDHEAFATAHPEVNLCRGRFVVDGNRITTGGALPTVDLMLEIIRRRQGYSLALEVSRLFIYEPETATSARAEVPSTSGLKRLDRRLEAAVSVMERTLDAPLSVEGLAGRVGLTARHLQSLFRTCLGVSPHEHYMALRLNAARRLVIETRQPFADIAPACGFASAAAFSRRYRAHYGESPRQTRRRF